MFTLVPVHSPFSAWLDAIRSSFPNWHVCVSPDLTDSEYAAGHALEKLSGRANVVTDKSLHLAVSMRSFRAENMPAFVKAVLDREPVEAGKTLAEISPRYPSHAGNGDGGVVLRTGQLQGCFRR